MAEYQDQYLSIFSLRLAGRPALFNPSSPDTESLNQGPAVFSTRLIYRRKSGWSAILPGAGAASGTNWVIVSAVLLSDWTNPTIGIEIKVLPSEIADDSNVTE